MQQIIMPVGTFVVTGASRGYGLAIIEELFKATDELYIIGLARTQSGLEALKLRYGSRFDYVVGDISDESMWNNVAMKIDALGYLDGLVNNAGMLAPIGPLSEISLNDVRRNFDTNLFGPMGLTQRLIPYLRSSDRVGRVLNISSGAATKGYFGWQAYCGSKAALNQFTRVLGIEEPNILSLAIRPGVLDTDMQKMIRNTDGEGMDTKTYEMFSQMSENGQLVQPEASARALINLLLSPHRKIKYAGINSGEFIDWDDEKISHCNISVVES